MSSEFMVDLDSLNQSIKSDGSICYNLSQQAGLHQYGSTIQLLLWGALIAGWVIGIWCGWSWHVWKVKNQEPEEPGEPEVE